MDRIGALVVTLAVGALIALQPPANALLARTVSDLGAAFVSLVISTLIVGVLLLVFGDPASLRGLSEFRPEYALGALGGAAVVLVSLITVRELGVGGVTAALVATQLIASVIVDRLGWLGVDVVSFGWQRGAGVSLLMLGTWLIVRTA
jgi:bacterial/archaeal transporter family-2 protein